MLLLGTSLWSLNFESRHACRGWTSLCIFGWLSKDLVEPLMLSWCHSHDALWCIWMAKSWDLDFEIIIWLEYPMREVGFGVLICTTIHSFWWTLEVDLMYFAWFAWARMSAQTMVTRASPLKAISWSLCVHIPLFALLLDFGTLSLIASACLILLEHLFWHAHSLFNLLPHLFYLCSCL